LLALFVHLSKLFGQSIGEGAVAEDFSAFGIGSVVVHRLDKPLTIGKGLRCSPEREA